MPPKIKKDLCIGCGACAAVCPNNAIELVDGKAVIDPKKCKNAFECIKVCPVQAIVKNKEK